MNDAIPIFDKINILLQRNEPCIHILRREQLSLLTDIYVRFVTPNAVASCKDVLHLEHNDKRNQRDNSEVFIGREARQYLRTLEEADAVSKGEIDIFFESVRRFYSAACTYIVSKCPLDSELLLCAEVADVSLRKTEQFSSVEYFVNKFPSLLGGRKMDDLEMEFLHYQVDTFSTEVTHNNVTDSLERIDTIWNNIGHLTSAGGNPKYGLLTNVMKQILVIPHSNADSERIFSTVRKNRTEFRPNLSDEQLSALLVQKFSMLAADVLCHELSFTDDLLKKAKSATYQSLKR
ncbi:uncharacterized protein LOC121368275 [Gigantopelta aegis]|uniref:uncharacterized protein LOC121368275 n=1 Tax=Gigantopelta aegis TaxID=1735272 RepID=UPI001B889B84|nr:uncharacterized protein LOC121368275 [Gigantopelta aegis]